jgi:hypothetical protein
MLHTSNTNDDASIFFDPRFELALELMCLFKCFWTGGRKRWTSISWDCDTRPWCFAGAAYISFTNT